MEATATPATATVTATSPMDLPLLLAVALLLLLTTLTIVGFRRGSRRLKGELVGLRRRHNAALEALVERDATYRWEIPPADDVWAALLYCTQGVTLRLSGESSLRRTTFIEYVTRLSITADDASFDIADLPRDVSSDTLATLQPRVPADLCACLALLAQSIRLQPDRLTITAMPTAELRRYSYAFRMQVSPETLQGLVDAGAQLARHLQRT